MSLFRWRLGFLLVFLFAQPTLSFGENIRITNGEWPPYLGEKLAYHGLASRIVSEAFALSGISVDYGFFPWSIALDLARKGDWDGAAVWLRTPEREDQFYVSEPVLASEYVFFHRKSLSFEWQTLEDLKPFRIGGTQEYAYGENFEKAEKTGALKIERVPTDEQNFRRLINGEIDLFPMDRAVGSYMLSSIFPPDVANSLTYHPKPLLAEPLYLLLSKKVAKNAELLALFNQGLQDLREKGLIEQYTDEALRGEYEQ